MGSESLRSHGLEERPALLQEKLEVVAFNRDDLALTPP